MGGFWRCPGPGHGGPEEWLAAPAGTGSEWQVNSVGWVSVGGRNYLIAVLTTGNPTEQYGVETIEALAAMVWQHMG